MIASSVYTLQPLPPGHPFPLHRRLLVAHGKTPAAVVAGENIRFEFGCGRNTLLATGTDHFESCEHFLYFLRPDGKPLDLVILPETFGFLGDVVPESPREVSFGFFAATDRWKLTVHEHGYWSYAPAVLRSRTLVFWPRKRYLEARRSTGPEASQANRGKEGQARISATRRSGTALI